MSQFIVLTSYISLMFHRWLTLISVYYLYTLCLAFSVISYLCSFPTSVWHVISWPGLAGDHGSVCHGSVLQGQFEGTIHTDNGTYHVEPVHRYTSNQTQHHSIIYHEDDMGKTTFIFLRRKKNLASAHICKLLFVIVVTSNSPQCPG